MLTNSDLFFTGARSFFYIFMYWSIYCGITINILNVMNLGNICSMYMSTSVIATSIQLRLLKRLCMPIIVTST